MCFLSYDGKMTYLECQLKVTMYTKYTQCNSKVYIDRQKPETLRRGFRIFE